MHILALFYSQLSLGLMAMLGVVVLAFLGYVVYHIIRDRPRRVAARTIKMQQQREIVALEHEYRLRELRQVREIELARAHMQASAAIYNEAAEHLARIDRSLHQNKLVLDESKEALREITRATAYRLAEVGSDAQKDVAPQPAPIEIPAAFMLGHTPTTPPASLVVPSPADG